MNVLAKLKPVVTGSALRLSHYVVLAALFGVLVWFYYHLGSVVSWLRPEWVTNFFTLEYIYRMHGSLFFIPFFYATIVFRWRGSLVLWGVSLAAIMPRMLQFSNMPVILTQNIFYSIIPLSAALFIFSLLNWREKETRIMAERESERQDYLSQIIKAQENERQRIAQELHDETMQSLVAIAQRAQTLLSSDNMKALPGESEVVGWVRDNLLHVTEELRRLSLDLRPGVLDNMGLVPAVRWLVSRMNQDTTVNTRIKITGDSDKLKPEDAVVVFRLVQEALNNVRQHSGATRASVELAFNSGHLNINVKDNGKGFAVPAGFHDFTRQGKLGIIGMRQRINLLGGDMDILSSPEAGTAIAFRLNIS